jgi:hypothetical protein
VLYWRNPWATYSIPAIGSNVATTLLHCYVYVLFKNPILFNLINTLTLQVAINAPWCIILYFLTLSINTRQFYSSRVESLKCCHWPNGIGLTKLGTKQSASTNLNPWISGAPWWTLLYYFALSHDRWVYSLSIIMYQF